MPCCPPLCMCLTSSVSSSESSYAKDCFVIFVLNVEVIPHATDEETIKSAASYLQKVNNCYIFRLLLT